MLRSYSLHCLVLAALLVLTDTAFAESEQSWRTLLLAPRGRAPFPLTNPAPAVEAYAALLGAARSPTVRGRVELALGGGGQGVSGTFAADVAYGRLLTNFAPNEGLIFRGGMDLFVDSLLTTKITRFSVPQLELGYVRYKPNHVIDVVLAAGPVLFSRMRYGDSLQRFPFAPQLGPKLLLHYQVIGLRLDSGFIPLSTVPGGPALWSRGMLCFVPSSFAACAEGFLARMEPAEAEPVGMGYLGLSIGFNLAEPWESDELP